MREEYKVKYRKKLFGIQKRLMIYVMLLVTLVLVVVAIGVISIVSRNTRENLMEQYAYVNDKVYRSFQNLYNDLNMVTENCITNESVQKSLKNRELSVYEKEIVSRTLGFFGSNYIDYFVYVDNKENIYSTAKIEINFDTFYKSRLYLGLGEDYSKVKLFWERDFLSGSLDMALFTGRYVRQLDRDYEPGMLYMKLDDAVINEMAEELGEDAPASFLADGQGQICYKSYSDDHWSDVQLQEVMAELPEIVAGAAEGIKATAQGYTVPTKLGIWFGEVHEQTGFTVLTFVPNRVINQVIWEILFTILIILVLVLVLGLFLSQFFTRQFTKPIRYISELMEHFDNSNLSREAVLNTNTELDYIGKSYNKMLGRIGHLITQVKYKERELRKAELDTLMYQIQPHFLYNTLDTVYMLARISKEKTIMKMIQSLSKYLRINLSNGAEEIAIAEELEHVKAYMEIQKIRNNDLFDYTIQCDEAIQELHVLKMILQPVVENCIKHGFYEMDEKGVIEILVQDMGAEVVFSVANNGMVMSEKERERLNRLERIELSSVGQAITHEKRGYGISNVVKRLRLRYEERIRFYYVISGHKTTCVIQIRKEMMVQNEK